MAQWKWRDASGQTHVSDRPPPPDIADRDVLQRPREAARRPEPSAVPASAAASAASGPAIGEARQRVDPELEARRRQAEQEQQAKAQQEEERRAAARAENCRRAREHQRTLESGMRVARINEKGEREYMSDAQRSSELQRTREAAAANCQ